MNFGALIIGDEILSGKRVDAHFKKIASLLGEPGVASLHDTNGRWDLLAELRAANLSELSQVLERIRLVRGISNTETSIHLQTYRLS